MTKVFLHKRMNLAKAKVLAPVSRRYEHKKTLANLPSKLVPMAIHSLLFHQGRALFIKNSKAASTSLCHKIYEWEKGTEYTGSTVHRDKTLSQGLWSYPDIVRAISDPDCLKVTILRDPVRRCVSGFTDFALDKKNNNYERHAPFWDAMGMSAARDDAQRFDIYLDYVQACIDKDIERMDEHFRPQFYNLRPDLIDYGFVGQVEHLRRDIHALGVRLGLETGEAPPGAQRKNSSRSQYSPTDAQIERIKALYAKDYAWLAQLFPESYNETFEKC
ncbi:sulfotransferase family protein [Actibacterium sp. XHP0104]|uniref:sulfotransferase family protein n=1 Tax=Actibacterium sp. XHP0104 TaxID=2984335 RepID=UPI0021E79473|nr:sulfotransferase family protein [Actibacterium sp. XHP0104]MCV2882983.1 sulfotransferase family protein [Actibacterium sp. XHP0104]